MMKTDTIENMFTRNNSLLIQQPGQTARVRERQSMHQHATPTLSDSRGLQLQD